MKLMAVDLLAVVVNGLMVGNELCVAAFVHPSISRLERRAHVLAAAAIARTLGRAMPFWYALGLLLLIAEAFIHRNVPGSFDLLLVAAALWAVTIAMTLALLVPRNNRVASADVESLYPGWAQDRSGWDLLHRVRVGLLAVAFVLQVAAVLPGA